MAWSRCQWQCATSSVILKSHTSDTFLVLFVFCVLSAISRGQGSCYNLQKDCSKSFILSLFLDRYPQKCVMCVCVCYKHEDFLYTKDTKSFSVVFLVVRCPPGTQKEVAKPSGLALLWHKGSLQFSSVCQGTSTTMGMSWASHTICWRKDVVPCANVMKTALFPGHNSVQQPLGQLRIGPGKNGMHGQKDPGVNYSIYLVVFLQWWV